MRYLALNGLYYLLFEVVTIGVDILAFIKLNFK